MWLFKSSIGRKVVMSVTGLCLVFFLTFHACMNVTVVVDDILGPGAGNWLSTILQVPSSADSAYGWICGALGANWYAVAATGGLAAFVLLHFVYAFILTIQNRKARGNDRYAVTKNWKEVDWNSKNMLVLGIIIAGFLVLHLYNFWFKMMFQELSGLHTGAFDPTNGGDYVKYLFTGLYNGEVVNADLLNMSGWMHPVYCVLYLVWFFALWYHLTHGIWSAFHTLGVNNSVWFNRIKVIGNIWATVIALMFSSVVFYYMGVYIGSLL